jgi:hypothetical protein
MEARMGTQERWTKEQIANAEKYGVCQVCGEPLEYKFTSRKKDGITRALSMIVCPNGHLRL